MKNSLSALLVALLTPSIVQAGNLPSAPSPIIDPTAIDRTISPCQDFYQFSCGNWVKRTEIPSDQSRWARSFDVVNQQNLDILHGVLEDYSAGTFTPKTPDAQKLGDFYASCMNETQVEQQGPSILRANLATIDALADKKDLPHAVAKLHLAGVPVFFSFTATPDLKDSTLQIAEVDQGGLGLPNSTYYTKTDPQSVLLRTVYQSHISKMFQLAGISKTEADLMSASAFEMELALGQSALPPESLQDPTTLYHPIDAAALKVQTPDFYWSAYFNGLGIKSPNIINLTESKFIHTLNSQIKDGSLARLKAYLKWHVIESLAPTLGRQIYAEYFSFEGATLNGEKAPAPRWKRCVRSVNSGMGEALGQAFVEKTFTPQAKARAVALIANLRTAFQNDLKNLDWLDALTQSAALEKLELLTQKIGYPDQWRNYDALTMSRDAYSQNVLRSAEAENLRVFRKIGGKVDPMEWAMIPQEVNAYYDPNVNQINFPAGILQAPFFSEQANDATNYGAIGMVIGHEMTHGFDTSGSQFDGHGVQRDWWSPAVKALFDKKAQCLIDQYSAYEALPGLRVNGKLTITENIADQGGLKLAYAAFKLAAAGKPPETPISGLSGDQQFYVAMAQMWCEKQTDESLRKQVVGDPHAPAKFRVVGTVVNSPDFSSAFGCESGAPMAPKDRCTIW